MIDEPDNDYLDSLTDDGNSNVKARIEDRLDAIRKRTVTVLDSFPTPEPLVADMIDLGTAAVINAQWGAFKSFLAVDLACHIALGRPWNGHGVPTGRNVHFLAFEAPASIHMRIRAWCEYHDVDPADIGNRITIDPRPGRLTDPIEVDALVLYLNHTDTGCVIVDTIARTARGVQENSSEFGDLFHNLDEYIASPTRAVVAIRRR